MKRRVAAVGIWVSLGALSAIPAAAGISAAAPSHLADLGKLYASDHHGKGPQSGSALLPYSKQFERLLAGCEIRPDDLTDATIFLTGEVRALAGDAPAGRSVSSLAMLQAFAHRITWSGRRGCWNGFYAVEGRMAARVATAQIANRNEVTALYVLDNRGADPHNDVDLLPYSNEFRTILASCWITPENATNTMIDLSQKASELGARNVSSLMMMKAITRRITWKNRQVCSGTFDLAEGHMESGGP